MSDQWNDELFKYFIQLRNTLRAAKKEKNYQHVLSLGLSILELDKTAGFLKIATPIFLKDVAEAYIRLGDTTSAVKYLMAAKDKFKEQQMKPDDWQKDIEVIDRKLKKLSTLNGRKRFQYWN